MTPYEQLRAIINKMFPERLELRFGTEICEKGWEEQIFTIITISRDKLFASGIWRLDRKEQHDIDNFDINLNVQTILGQPLTLADVCRALRDARNGWSIDASIHLNFLHIHGDREIANGAKEILVSLDLSKTVSDWSDETINKIISLIE